MHANQHLYYAHQNPYDRTDEEFEDGVIKRPVDAAHAAARGILHDFLDRGGIKHVLNDIDEETRIEIVSTMADIIRAAPDWFERHAKP